MQKLVQRTFLQKFTSMPLAAGGVLALPAGLLNLGAFAGMSALRTRAGFAFSERFFGPLDFLTKGSPRKVLTLREY